MRERVHELFETKDELLHFNKNFKGQRCCCLICCRLLSSVINHFFVRYLVIKMTNLWRADWGWRLEADLRSIKWWIMDNGYCKVYGWILHEIKGANRNFYISGRLLSIFGQYWCMKVKTASLSGSECNFLWISMFLIFILLSLH